MLLACSYLLPHAAFARLESFTYRLNQSISKTVFGTTLPSEKVLKDSAVSLATCSEVKVYAAKNEFEPFQVVVRPTSSGNVTRSELIFY
ncbi:MAG: hypothetical protein ACI8PB_005295 [Desulforhopalus sp.]|jgi:hypothetical protein